MRPLCQVCGSKHFAREPHVFASNARAKASNAFFSASNKLFEKLDKASNTASNGDSLASNGTERGLVHDSSRGRGLCGAASAGAVQSDHRETDRSGGVQEAKQRWARDKYNAYQRFLMQSIRAIKSGRAVRI